MNIKLVLKGLIVGIIVGVFIIIYRSALTCAEEFAINMYGFLKNNMIFIPVWFGVLIILAYIVGKLIDREPYISGSGIPQVKGLMGGYIKNRPISIMINKMIGGTLAILGGLSLGREGPSVQLGACVGDLVSKNSNSTRLERRLLVSSGASAGLAAAFNAPLAGVLFSLEEILKYFSPIVLLATVTASVAADFLAKQFFGLRPVFNFDGTALIPLRSYWVLVILGAILGILGVFYNWLTLKTQDLFGKLKCSTSTKLMIPFVLAGFLGLLLPMVLGGGHAILGNLTLSSTLGFLIIILIVKFLFSIISFGSGAPGGIFFPLLIIGGTIGAIFGSIMINFFGMESNCLNSFIILSMAGYFAAIVRAPITGIILITEMTGTFSQLLSLTVVSIIAFFTAELLKSAPIYDSLLESLLKKNNVKDYHNESTKKVLITNIVHFGSKIEDKQLSSISLPENTLVVSIKRGENTIVPKGNTVVKAGDQIITITDLKNESSIRELLEELTVVE